MDGELLLRLILVAGSFQRCSQSVVDLWIFRHQPFRAAKGRDGLFILLHSNETNPATQLSFGEIGI